MLLAFSIALSAYVTVVAVGMARAKPVPPARTRHLTTIELVAIAEGGLEPHGTIDRQAARKILAGWDV